MINITDEEKNTIVSICSDLASEFYDGDEDKIIQKLPPIYEAMKALLTSMVMEMYKTREEALIASNKAYMDSEVAKARSEMLRNANLEADAIIRKARKFGKPTVPGDTYVESWVSDNASFAHTPTRYVVPMNVLETINNRVHKRMMADKEGFEKLLAELIFNSCKKQLLEASVFEVYSNPLASFYEEDLFSVRTTTILANLTGFREDAEALKHIVQNFRMKGV